jgi:hypothetical protein
MATIIEINSKVMNFANDYEHEKQKVMRTLWSCKTLLQLEIAENFFKVLKNKWKEVMKVNATIRLLVEVDEYKFYKEFNSMEAQFKYA